MKKRLVLYSILSFAVLAFGAILLLDRWFSRPVPMEGGSISNPTPQPTPIRTMLPTSISGDDSLGTLMAKLFELPQNEDEESDPAPDRTIPYLEAIHKKVFAELEKDIRPLSSPQEASRAQKAMDDTIARANAERNKYLNENFKDGAGIGSIDKVSIQEVPGHPDLLAVEVPMSLNCDHDSSFYIYQKQKDGWQLVLRRGWDGRVFMDDFSYVISPPDEKGDFFIVTVYEGPHCQSCWGGFSYQVYRLGPDAAHPVTLLDNGDLYRRCEGYHLDLDPHGFTVTFETYQTLDFMAENGIFLRTTVRHYEVHQGQAVRTAPYANYPEDFVDEWREQPWEKAAALCNPGDKNILHWHKVLQNIQDLNPHLLFVQKCTGGPDRWEIGLTMKAAGLPSVIYFEVTRLNGNFFLEEIREKRRPDCPGETKPEDHGD